MIKLAGGSILSGELPKGCRLCRSGLKSVIFITGICPRNCFYCPVALSRRGDVVAVNELIVTRSKSGYLDIEEIDREKLLEEIRVSGSYGASITGGDPLMVPDRVAFAIRLLKEEFGEGFHVHLYTSAPKADMRILEKLYDAGLDEIRIHPVDDKGFKLAEMAREFPRDVGFEIPVIPLEPYIKRARDVIRKAIELELRFVNLNELEATEANIKRLISHGLHVKKGEIAAVESSYEAGIELIKEFEGEITLHLCTAKAKDSVQFRNRLIRRARLNAKPYHIVTDDGTRIYAEAYGNVDELRELLEHLEVPKELREECGDVICMDAELAKDLAQELKEELQGKVRIKLVERYPTADRVSMYEERLI